MQFAPADQAAEVRPERPNLVIRRYGIGFHFAAAWGERPDSPARATNVPSPLASFERDLIAYAYAHRPPLATHHIAELPQGLERLTIRFPGRLVFRSEANRIALETATPDRTVALRASETRFLQSRLRILNLVLGRRCG